MQSLPIRSARYASMYSAFFATVIWASGCESSKPPPIAAQPTTVPYVSIAGRDSDVSIDPHTIITQSVVLMNDLQEARSVRSQLVRMRYDAQIRGDVQLLELLEPKIQMVERRIGELWSAQNDLHDAHPRDPLDG